MVARTWHGSSPNAPAVPYFYCWACGHGGDTLVACSTCPRTLHATCCTLAAGAPTAGLKSIEEGASPHTASVEWQCPMCRCMRCGSGCTGPCLQGATGTPEDHTANPVNGYKQGACSAGVGVGLGLLHSIEALKAHGQWVQPVPRAALALTTRCQQHAAACGSISELRMELEQVLQGGQDTSMPRNDLPLCNLAASMLPTETWKGRTWALDALAHCLFIAAHPDKAPDNLGPHSGKAVPLTNGAHGPLPAHTGVTGVDHNASGDCYHGPMLLPMAPPSSNGRLGSFRPLPRLSDCKPPAPAPVGQATTEGANGVLLPPHYSINSTSSSGPQQGDGTQPTRERLQDQYQNWQQDQQQQQQTNTEGHEAEAQYVRVLSRRRKKWYERKKARALSGTLELPQDPEMKVDEVQPNQQQPQQQQGNECARDSIDDCQPDASAATHSTGGCHPRPAVGSSTGWHKHSVLVCACCWRPCHFGCLSEAEREVLCNLHSTNLSSQQPLVPSGSTAAPHHSGPQPPHTEAAQVAPNSTAGTHTQLQTDCCVGGLQAGEWYCGPGCKQVAAALGELCARGRLPASQDQGPGGQAEARAGAGSENGGAGEQAREQGQHATLGVAAASVVGGAGAANAGKGLTSYWQLLPLARACNVAEIKDPLSIEQAGEASEASVLSQAIEKRLLHGLGLHPGSRSPPAPATLNAAAGQEAQHLQALCLKVALKHLQAQLRLDPATAGSPHRPTQQQAALQQQQPGAVQTGSQQPTVGPDSIGAALMDCDHASEANGGAPPAGTAAYTATNNASTVGSVPLGPAGLTPAQLAAPSSSTARTGDAQPAPGYYAALLWGRAAEVDAATQAGSLHVPLAMAVLRVHGPAAAQVLLALPLHSSPTQVTSQAQPEGSQKQQQQAVFQLLGLLAHAFRDAGVAQMLVHAKGQGPNASLASHEQQCQEGKEDPLAACSPCLLSQSDLASAYGYCELSQQAADKLLGHPYVKGIPGAKQVVLLQQLLRQAPVSAQPPKASQDAVAGEGPGGACYAHEQQQGGMATGELIFPLAAAAVAQDPPGNGPQRSASPSPQKQLQQPQPQQDQNNRAGSPSPSRSATHYPSRSRSRKSHIQRSSTPPRSRTRSPSRSCGRSCSQCSHPRSRSNSTRSRSRSITCSSSHGPGQSARPESMHTTSGQVPSQQQHQPAAQASRPWVDQDRGSHKHQGHSSSTCPPGLPSASTGAEDSTQGGHGDGDCGELGGGGSLGGASAVQFTSPAGMQPAATAAQVPATQASKKEHGAEEAEEGEGSGMQEAPQKATPAPAAGATPAAATAVVSKPGSGLSRGAVGMGQTGAAGRGVGLSGVHAEGTGPLGLGGSGIGTSRGSMHKLAGVGQQTQPLSLAAQAAGGAGVNRPGAQPAGPHAPSQVVQHSIMGGVGVGAGPSSGKAFVAGGNGGGGPGYRKGGGAHGGAMPGTPVGLGRGLGGVNGMHGGLPHAAGQQQRQQANAVGSTMPRPPGASPHNHAAAAGTQRHANTGEWVQVAAAGGAPHVHPGQSARADMANGGAAGAAAGGTHAAAGANNGGAPRAAADQTNANGHRGACPSSSHSRRSAHSPSSSGSGRYSSESGSRSYSSSRSRSYSSGGRSSSRSGSYSTSNSGSATRSDSRSRSTSRSRSPRQHRLSSHAKPARGAQSGQPQQQAGNRVAAPSQHPKHGAVNGAALRAGSSTVVGAAEMGRAVVVATNGSCPLNSQQQCAGTGEASGKVRVGSGSLKREMIAGDAAGASARQVVPRGLDAADVAAARNGGPPQGRTYSAAAGMRPGVARNTHQSADGGQLEQLRPFTAQPRGFAGASRGGFGGVGPSGRPFTAAGPGGMAARPFKRMRADAAGLPLGADDVDEGGRHQGGRWDEEGEAEPLPARPNAGRMRGLAGAMGLGGFLLDEGLQQQFMAAMQAMSNHPLMVAALTKGGGGSPSMPPPEVIEHLMDSIILQQQRRQQGQARRSRAIAAACMAAGALPSGAAASVGDTLPLVSPGTAGRAAAAEGGRLSGSGQPHMMQQMMAMFASMQRAGGVLPRVAGGSRPMRLSGYMRGGGSAMRGGSFLSSRGGGLPKFSAVRHGGGEDVEEEGMEGEEGADGGYYGSYEEGSSRRARSNAGGGFEGGSGCGGGMRGGMHGGWTGGRVSFRGRSGPSGGRFGGDLGGGRGSTYVRDGSGGYGTMRDGGAGPASRGRMQVCGPSRYSGGTGYGKTRGCARGGGDGYTMPPVKHLSEMGDAGR